ncbi:MAG TPA: MFS transporter [Burkholderiaceae bacterium]|nr:MFS transporter [Burkholderiaceae bacterium]
MQSSRHEQWMLVTLAAIQFTATLDFMVMMPLAPQFTRIFGLSAREFGFLISAYTFAAAAAGIVTSLFVDRFDRRQLLLAVYLGFVGAALATTAAPSYPLLLLARALAGIFGGVLGGLIFTIIGDAVPESRRGRATGIVMTSFSVATVAGVPLALVLTNLIGWRAAFGLVAVLGIAAGLTARRTLPEARHAGARAGRGVWTEFRSTLMFPNHLRAFLFTLLMMLSGFSVIPYVSLYITSNAGVAERDLPWIYLVGGMATFFTARWIGRWADRAGKRRAYRKIAWVSLIPLVAITHAPILPLAAVLLLTTLFFVFVSGRMVPAMAIVTSAARPGARGAFMALNSAVLQIGSGVAATLSGAIVQRSASGALMNYNWVGYVAVAATLIAIAWVGTVRSLDAPTSNIGPSAR